MKLSEKFKEARRFETSVGIFAMDFVNLEIYKQICTLEAQQTLLVSNPDTFPQERYVDKLAEIVNSLEEIKIKEKL